ncbi:hypothetical protein ACLMJK_008226 [Lecanora helva]
MIPTFYVHSVLWLVILQISSAFTILRHNLTSQITQSAHPINFTTNSSLPLTTQKLSDTRLTCDGSTYKRNLIRDSCVDAASTIPRDEEPLSVADRTYGDIDIPLPARWISGDGRCVFDIAKASNDPIEVDFASLKDFSTAASMLIGSCLGRGGRQGGIVTGLGASGRLGLIMTSYAPTVTCGEAESFFPRDSCHDIISLMPATKELDAFGRVGQRWVEIEIPNTFYSVSFPGGKEDRRCKSTVDSSGLRDVASWYDMWQGVVAVDGMCGRFNRVGYAGGIGSSRSLKIDLEMNDEVTATA